MNEKTYNMYMKMIKLACGNVKTEICRINMFRNPDVVQVKIRSKDSLVNLVDKIFKHSKDAVTLYSDKADNFLVIRCSEPTVHMLTASKIFVDSLVRSKDARMAQKRLIDFLTAEHFLRKGYDADSKNHSGQKCLEKAKSIVSKAYGLGFLGSFIFDGGRPHLDENLRTSLMDAAFDERFSFMSEESLMQHVDRKYKNDFESKERLLDGSLSVAEKAAGIKTGVVKTAKAAAKIFRKETPVNVHTIMLDDLYKRTFADLPLMNRRRRFINLKARNNDIMICPFISLAGKKQFAEIDAMTKRQYIMEYYEDRMPSGITSLREKAHYYFRCENEMYRQMWKVSQPVRYEDRKLCFPDGTRIAVPGDYKPYEFFHKVNAVYAALFGFTSEDVKGGSEWLSDSIRKAYTDEGMADYRVELVKKRLKSET